MISRLTASAATFAAFATVAFAVAADARQAPSTARAVVAEPMPVVVMPRVEITGLRTRGR